MNSRLVVLMLITACSDAQTADVVGIDISGRVGGWVAVGAQQEYLFLLGQPHSPQSLSFRGECIAGQVIASPGSIVTSHVTANAVVREWQVVGATSYFVLAAPGHECNWPSE